MEATLRPYDRGEEATPFATLGSTMLTVPYHHFVLLSYRGGGGSEQKRVRKERLLEGRAASAAYPAHLNSQM